MRFFVNNHVVTLVERLAADIALEGLLAGVDASVNRPVAPEKINLSFVI